VLFSVAPHNVALRLLPERPSFPLHLARARDDREASIAMALTTADAGSVKNAPAALPGWVRVLDVVSVCLLAGAAVLMIGDGVRIDIAGVRIAITSPARVIAWAAVAMIARHVVYATPALPARAWTWAQRHIVWPEISFVAQVVLTTRILPVVIGLLAVATIGLGSEARYQVYASPWLNLPARWDAAWYSDIAAFGYSWNGDWTRQQNVVFFPAFPIAARIVSRLLGVHVLYAAWFVSFAAFAVAMLFFVRLARKHLDTRSASDAAWLLASYPFAVYFSAAYSESLFLLTMCGMFLAVQEGWFGRALMWGLAAGLTRPNGWLLALPLALLVHTHLRPSRLGEWVRATALVAAPVAGMLLFTWYLHLRFADGFAWLRGQAAWGRTYRGLHLFAADRISYITEHGLSRYLVDDPFDALNSGAALLALGLIVPITRRLGAAYGALVAALALPPLLIGGAMSMGRITSVLFPMFIWLAADVPIKYRTGLLIAFATLQGFAAALFFTWRPLF